MSCTRADGINRIDALMHEHRQVLSYDVSKVGPKHAYVKASTVAHAHNRFRFHLVSDADARTKSTQVAVDISIESKRAFSGHSDHALLDVRKSPQILAGHRFGSIILPADAVRNCQFRGYPEAVLTVQKVPTLSFSGVGTEAVEPFEERDVTEQERCQIQSTHL